LVALSDNCPVTGELLKCFIDPDDCAIPPADENGIGGRFKCSRLQLQQILYTGNLGVGTAFCDETARNTP